MNTLLTMESVYDSIEFAGRKQLRQYRKLLKKLMICQTIIGPWILTICVLRHYHGLKST